MARGELLRDGAAVGVSEHVGGVDTKGAQQRRGEVRQLDDRQWQKGRRAVPDAGRVKTDHRSLTERRHEEVPTVDGSRQSVDEEKWFSHTLDTHVNLVAFDAQREFLSRLGGNTHARTRT